MDSTLKETRITGRYVTLKHINPLLESYGDVLKISTIGISELGKKIPLVTLGQGSKKILVWSQMHGNESTTTKAILDFLKLVSVKNGTSEAIDTFLESHTLKIIPILNPDGAVAYTRENANNVDLNRDAQHLSQKESQALRAVFDEFKPDLCLNMHDQRTIYGLDTGKPATVSFLAPAADKTRSITKARTTAMSYIALMYSVLSTDLPGQIGRYDDGFNINCVGDTFTHLGVPTILFEAGHYPKDYTREVTRSFIFKALLVVFNISEANKKYTIQDYLDIPENQKNYCDVVLKNVRTSPKATPQDIAIQYIEVLKEGNILFMPSILEYNTVLSGLATKDFQGDHIVFNNGEMMSLNEKLDFVYNKTKEIAISLRIS